MAEVAILVPILNRPHRIIPLLASIAAATDVSHEVIFAASDQPSIDVLESVGARYITDTGDDEGTYPKRINRLFNETNASYVFLGADDLDFRPGWFQAAMIKMDQMQGGGVVAVSDLHNSAGTHFLVSRQYVQELGGCRNEPGIVLHEGYRHTYCDDELRSTAKFHDRYLVATDSVVEHLHPGAGKAPTDETYRIGEASMSQGRELYMSRGHLWASA